VSTTVDNGASGANQEVTGVTKLSPTDYKVERAEVDRALSNLNEVATQARMVPSLKNGKPNGFKVFSIKPGSIYSKIGLQNGDVIQKINGYDLNSPDRALEIYTKLRDATSLSIELQRGGNTQTMNYAIN
jgi:general secretion pathway protein C